MWSQDQVFVSRVKIAVLILNFFFVLIFCFWFSA